MCRRNQVLAAAVLAGLTGTAQAVLFEVGPGKPYATIQSAVDAAAALDVPNTTLNTPNPDPVNIRIYSGNYNENVAIPADGSTAPNQNDRYNGYNDGWVISAAPGENVWLTGGFDIGMERDNGVIDGINIKQTASTGWGYNFNFLARQWKVKNGIVYQDGSSTKGAGRGELQYGATDYDHMTIFGAQYGLSLNYAAWGGIKNSILANVLDVAIGGYNSYAGVKFGYGNSLFYNNNVNVAGPLTQDNGGNIFGSDPMFVSTDPNSPYFLYLQSGSPAATAGIGGTYMGARPVSVPNQNQWSLDGDGIWNDPGNWSVSIPNAVGATAVFGNAISAPHTVTVDAPVTVGHVLFDNLNQSYTIGGSSTLSLEVSSGTADITVFAGNHSITAPLAIVSNADIVGPGSLTTGNIANAGALTIKTNVIAGNLDGAGSTTVDPGKSLSAAHIRQSSLVLNGSAVISSARASSNTSSVPSLTLGVNGKLDLGSNDLVIDYTGGSPLSAVKTAITTGYAGGAWNGATGITSSSAAATHLSAHPTGLGYGEASALGIGSFSGQTLTGDALVVRYTYLGDANLDGTVDSLDFTRLVNGYGQSGAVWTQGDFNFDEKVNTLDFNSLAGNFGQVLASPTLGTVVPEPGTIGLASMMAAALLTRRRRGC